MLGAVMDCEDRVMTESLPPVSEGDQLHERVGAVITYRFASTTFFCCAAFRTCYGTVRKLSQMRG
jgi:hypothetical protein